MRKKSLVTAVKYNKKPDVQNNSVKKIDKELMEEVYKPTARLKKKMIGGYFDPLASIQMHEIANECARGNGIRPKINELVREALNDFFEKYNKNKIA